MSMGNLWHALLSVAGLYCLIPSLVVAAPYDLWEFDPDYNTTLPDIEGIPPISRNASRDRALLKWQILGIVGGYVLTVLFLFTLLFTVGRRLRRGAQCSQGTLSMEMVKPNRWMADPSPKVKQSRWGKKTPTASLASTSQATFDTSTVVSHKERQEQDMERLYAAVFNSETKSPMDINVKEQEVGGAPGHTRNLSSSSKRSFSQRKPPQLAEPEHALQAPISPASPQASYQPPGNMYNIQGRPDSDSSLRSKSTLNSPPPQPAKTSKSKSARSLRKLTISPPMPTNKYPGAEEGEEASTPLSPRHLRARPITPIQDEYDAEEGDIARPYSYEELDQPRPLPVAAPQRPNATGADHLRIPPPLPPPPKDISPVSAGSASNPLPFRQHVPASSGSTLSGTTAGVTSPGLTKTTMLSPRRDRFAPGQGHPHGFVGVGTPHGAALETAGLASPYSAYMPFSPMTPVTPRLTTRAERKQRQREEGRRVANADEDQVKDEKEMWGDAW